MTCIKSLDSAANISFLILLFGHLSLYSSRMGIAGMTVKGSFSLLRLDHIAYITPAAAQNITLTLCDGRIFLLPEKVLWHRSSPYPSS